MFTKKRLIELQNRLWKRPFPIQLLQQCIARMTKISRKCVACEMEEKEEEDDNKKVKLSIGRKSLSNSNNLEATDEITNQINKVRSSEGSSLDNATRDFLEPKFGYDLSDVRIHTGEMGARFCCITKFSCLYYRK